MKQHRRLFALLAAALLLAVLPADSPPAGEKPSQAGRRGGDDCLYGRVKVVESFPDYRVQVVTAFPDLRVRKVTAFPDTCGKWQMVDSFPDFTVQYVDSFPDLRIQFVDSFPGKP